MQNARFSRGFSFIEIMIVVSIMGLTLGGVAVGYRQFNQRQILIAAGKDVVVAMRQAQARATSGTKANPACIILQGYSLTGVVGSGGTPSSYTLNLVCRDTPMGANRSFLIQTTNLPSIVRFNNAFTFTFLGQGGVDPAPFGGQTIDIGVRPVSTTTPVYTIRVSRAGSIDDIGLP